MLNAEEVLLFVHQTIFGIMDVWNFAAIQILKTVEMFSQQFLTQTSVLYQEQVNRIAKPLLARLARDLMLLEWKMGNVVVN